MTNAEKIRGMTDEELAIKFAELVPGWIAGHCVQCPAVETCSGDSGKTCEEDICAWLKQEADE